MHVREDGDSVFLGVVYKDMIIPKMCICWFYGGYWGLIWHRDNDMVGLSLMR